MLGRRQCVAGLSVVVVMALLALGCKQQDPKGELKPSTIEAKVGEVKHMDLLLPFKFDKLHHEVWSVEPKELGSVHFNEAEPQRRNASFEAKKEGVGKIVVEGFFEDPKKVYVVAEAPVTVSAK